MGLEAREEEAVSSKEDVVAEAKETQERALGPWLLNLIIT